MKNLVLVGAIAAGLLGYGSEADAATFNGYIETTDVYFDGAATFDYDPLFVGGSIFDPVFQVNVALSTDLATGSLLLTAGLFTPVLDGSVVDTMLSVDNGFAGDTFSMLFEIVAGSADYAIATFTGDLDGFGFTDFFTDGVLFADGNLSIAGAELDTTVIPLPAGLPLLLSGVGGLLLLRRKRKG